MGEKISFVLPVLSIAILSLFFLRPGITGFVIAPARVLNADIEVTTAEGVILPADSVIEVSVAGKNSSMPISVFIERSGGPYELVRGEVPEIGYSGPGYTGNHTYTVPVADFNLSMEMGRGMHVISVSITRNGTAISGNEREFIA